MAINLSIRFVHQDPADMTFAVVTFWGDVLTQEQLAEIRERLLGLRSCGYARISCDGKSMLVDADFGGRHEASFVTDLEECARQHYCVKRVSHDCKAIQEK